MLNDGVLSESGSLCSCRIKGNAITERENVFEFLMLQSVLIHINTTISVSNTSINQFFVLFAGRIDRSSLEGFLDRLAIFNVLEGCDLLVVFVELHAKHFPAEENLDSSLLAFVKCYFVGVREGEDLIIGGPELDF